MLSRLPFKNSSYIILYRYVMESCAKSDPWAPMRDTHFLKTLSKGEQLSCGWRRLSTAGPNKVTISAMCIKKKNVCN